MHRRENKGLGFLVRIKQVAQVSDAPLAFDSPVECLHHEAVGRLVEGELDSQIAGVLQGEQIAVIGDDAHHAVAIYIADGGSEGKVLDLAVLVLMEEHHRLAKLECMFDVLVGCTENLHHQLVERIIVALSHLQGPPRIAALHFPQNPHFFGLLAKRFLLGLILQLEQQPLLL